MDARVERTPDAPSPSVRRGLPGPASSATEPARRLALIALSVVAVDWGSKALAWRLLPGSAVINADTSGALPILPGLISQPALGAVVDATALVLLSVTGVWLARAPKVGGLVWSACALLWAGIGSNAVDRWFAHLWLAPGSGRGVVDWIRVDAKAAINLADVVIGVGIIVGVVGLAARHLPRGARAAVAASVLVLVPISVLTTGGASSNAAPPPPVTTFDQQVRATFWVGPKSDGHRIVWRDWRLGLGWDLTVEATDSQGLVLAQWRLPSASTVSALDLPLGTSTLYVRLDDSGHSVVLADGLS